VWWPQIAVQCRQASPTCAGDTATPAPWLRHVSVDGRRQQWCRHVESQTRLRPHPAHLPDYQATTSEDHYWPSVATITHPQSCTQRASCLINLWAFCHTPWICNFVNSLIYSVCLFTELHHSQIPFQLIWSTCPAFFYFDPFCFD